MLVARLPGDHDRRALADRLRLRARDTDAQALTSSVADDEHAVAVIDDHADLDHQAVWKPRVVPDHLKTLGTHEHIDGRAREAPAGVGIRLDRPDAVELDVPWRTGVDTAGEEVAVADELAHESGARPVIHLERRRRLLERAMADNFASLQDWMQDEIIFYPDRNIRRILISYWAMLTARELLVK